MKLVDLSGCDLCAALSIVVLFQNDTFLKCYLCVLDVQKTPLQAALRSPDLSVVKV